MSELIFKRDHNYSASVTQEGAEFEETWIVEKVFQPGEDRLQFIEYEEVLIYAPQFTPGESHPSRSYAKVTGFDVEQPDEHDIGKVIVSYVVGEQNTNTVRPLSEPPKISLKSATIQIPVLFDRNGDPIVNTAGDLVTGLKRPLSVWVINISMNVASVPRWIGSYGDAVNNSSVRLRGIDFPKRTLKLVDINIPTEEFHQDSGEEYIPMEIEIHYREDTWVEKYPNKGLYELIEESDGAFGDSETITEKKIRITNKDGTPVSQPQFLNEDGRRPFTVDDDGNEVIKERLDPEDIVTNEYDLLNEKSFSAFTRR